MITTKDVRIKDRKTEKVGILTSNVVKPKVFNVKGKPAKPVDIIITTSNVGIYKAKRDKELAKEKAAAKIRQKKLDEEIKVNKEKEKKAEKAFKGLITAERSY